MGIIDNIKHNLSLMKKSSRRFIVTLVLAMVFGIVSIWLDRLNYQVGYYEMVRKIRMTLFIATIFSLSIGIYLEGEKKDLKIKLASYAGLGILSFLYYSFILNDGFVSRSRYMGLILIAVISIFYVARLRVKEGHEFYAIDILKGIGLAFIYSLVLYLGISAIILTITSLFEIDIDGSIYYYIFIIIGTMFAPILFISRIPEADGLYEERNLSPAFNSLIVYILIPLISVYSLILYVYFVKILITRDWPQGLVSHLVLWYSIVSIGVLFFISNSDNKTRISRYFRRYFPKLNIPIIFMMFLSLYKRVAQYGFTENRYYVLIGGLWVLAMMVYHIVREDENNILVPVSMSLFILVSLIGPLSSFSVSKLSQNRRLEGILSKNEMIMDGKLVKNDSLNEDDEMEINNIIYYFDNNHSLSDIKVFPRDIKKEDIVGLLGIKYKGEISRNDRQWINYQREDEGIILEVEGYRHMIISGGWEDIEEEKDGYRFSLKNDKFKIEENEEVLREINIKEELVKLIDREDIDNLDKKEYIYMDEDVKILINYFSGYVNYKSRVDIDRYECIILIK